MAYDFHYTPTGTGVISGKEVLEQTEDAINDLGDQISGDVQTAIDTANNALNTANTASVDAQNAVNTASTAYTAATNAQNTANTAQNTASNALTAAQNAQNDVNALGNRVTTAEGNITQNTNAITGLTTRMGTAESNITNLQTAVSTAQATANSAQQTATTARQQSYVFRYSGTAVVPNSTIAYSTIDNTDNIKSGDKILDVDGKLFEITAVDTANQTVTVGSALIDLALDANVMHLSGNESASGNKNFKGLITTIPNETLWPETTNTTADITSLGGSSIHIEYKASGKLTDLSGGAWTAVELGEGCFFFRINNGTDIRYKHFPTNSVNRIPVVSNTNRQINSLTPETDNTYNLGDSTRRWKQINGINPSSLGMPDLSNGIDISGYITNFGAGTVNEYTPVADGWISIANSGDSPVFIRVYNDYGFEQIVYSERNEVGGTTGGSYTRFGSLMIPCIKNIKIYIIVSPSTSVLVSAKFFPCQGNI